MKMGETPMLLKHTLTLLTFCFVQATVIHMQVLRMAIPMDHMAILTLTRFDLFYFFLFYHKTFCFVFENLLLLL